MGLLDKVGGAYYISELTNRVASAANVEFHARIILEKYILQELIAYRATSPPRPLKKRPTFLNSRIRPKRNSFR